MRPDDIDAVIDVCADALWGPIREEARPWQLGRVGHLLACDPGGAWVAEDDGRVVGTAMAILRDGVWGLSLLALDEGLRGRGAGRALLDPALAYGDGARGAIVLSSAHPAAMRLYARAGFELRPCVSLGGHVRTAPPAPAAVRDGSYEDTAWIDEIAVLVRGAPYSQDLPSMFAVGMRLRCVEGRGFLLSRGGSVRLCAALDEQAATWLLEDVLANAGGAQVDVEFLTSGQDWAIRPGLDAGLALSPDGPVFTRGELGALRPWVPSGAYL